MISVIFYMNSVGALGFSLWVLLNLFNWSLVMVYKNWICTDFECWAKLLLWLITLSWALTLWTLFQFWGSYDQFICEQLKPHILLLTVKICHKILCQEIVASKGVNQNPQLNLSCILFLFPYELIPGMMLNLFVSKYEDHLFELA